MRLEVNESNMRVFLSRHNLLALLAKLDGHPKHSLCTLTYKTDDGKSLAVTAEEDAAHYANPERATSVHGSCHPETESHIAQEATSSMSMLAALKEVDRLYTNYGLEAKDPACGKMICAVRDEIDKAENGFPTPQDMLDSVPNEEAIRIRLDQRFSRIEKKLDPEGQSDLDYFITLTAHEWDSALYVIQTTYQKLLVKMKENCAKVVCPMCAADDPRETENGHEVHTIKSVDHLASSFGYPVYAYIKARCGANSIWSMK